jgi:hypothetical protein
MLSAIVRDDALWAIALLSLVIGLADWGFAILRALKDKVFSAEYVAEYLTGHVALRFGPIVLLAFIAATVNAVVASAPSLPDTLKAFAPSVTVAAWAGLLAYAVETVASLKATSEGDVLGADKP